MLKTKYYCEACGRETDYKKLTHLTFYNKSEYETITKENIYFRTMDICPDCNSAMVDFMKGIKW